MKRMLIMGIIAFIASLFGHEERPDMLDGPGMVYVDSDYRSVYANALEFDWDETEGYPMFAVAYLGKGEDVGANRDTYVQQAFKDFSESELESVKHFDFGGDEWYLIIPRYNEFVYVTNTESGEEITLIEGEAFTANCKGNLVVENHSHGGHRYIPELSENEKLVATEDVADITDYFLANNN